MKKNYILKIFEAKNGNERNPDLLQEIFLIANTKKEAFLEAQEIFESKIFGWYANSDSVDYCLKQELEEKIDDLKEKIENGDDEDGDARDELEEIYCNNSSYRSDALCEINSCQFTPIFERGNKKFYYDNFCNYYKVFSKKA